MGTIANLHKQISAICNRAWRTLATGFCFMLFGISGLLMSTFWFSWLRLTIKDEAKRNQITQNSIRKSFQLFLKITQTLRALSYHIDGAELFNDDKGCLVVVNHPSLLDYVFLASCMPRCDCIVKKSLLNNFFMRGVIKSAGYIPNEESETLLILCEKKLNEGGTILVFPEGTRTTPGKGIELHRGAANIALRCHANIRIVHIHCNQPMLTKQEKWYNIPQVKPIFTITVQDKIDITDFISENNKPLPILARRLTEKLKSKLEHISN